MAWWQKKLLHYALSRTGLLDDKAIDPKNLDITLGRKNVVELKDVGLNIKRISKLAQLPPSLRVETARVVLLRLTVPADIYQSSIVAEVDGVELSVKLEQVVEEGGKKSKSRAKSPVSVRSPQHRKAHRRLHSPPPYDPGGLSDEDEIVHLPTTQEMAMSFLHDEPLQEKRELEASFAPSNKGVEESVVSESSEGDDIGTGAAVGLPGFLASFLQGIVDRLRVHIRNVEVKIETEVAGEGQETMPVTLRLRIGAAELAHLDAEERQAGHAGKRQVKLQNIVVDLLSDAALFSDLSERPSRSSPTDGKSPSHSRPSSDAASQVLARPTTSGTQLSTGSTDSHARSAQSSISPNALQASMATVDADRFADAGEEVAMHYAQLETSELDIQPGDDNISWGSRRSKTSAPTADLWNSMASEDDLPDSLLLERASTPKAQPVRTASPTVARSRRAVSPYDRSLHSPGSWPRAGESPDSNRLQQSPGSWPMLDQSQHSLYQPLTPGPALELEDPMDNKRTAFEASMPPTQALLADDDHGLASKPAEGQFEDLAQSRLYSHEEAESMYMSAMTQSPKMRIPGGWNSEVMPGEQLTSPEGHGELQPDDSATSAGGFHDDSGIQSDVATPRAPSPAAEEETTEFPKLAAKQLLSVDEISLWLPKSTDAGAAEVDDAGRNLRTTHAGASPAARGMPGTFSAYSDLAASRRRGTSSATEENKNVSWSPQSRKLTEDDDSGLAINLGSVRATVDLSSCRLLYALVSVAGQSLKPEVSPAGKSRPGAPNATRPSVAAPVSVSVQRFRVSLLEQLPLQHIPDMETGLMTLTCDTVEFSASHGDINLRLGRLRALLSGTELLSFDRQAKMSSSILLTNSTPDIALTIKTNKFTVHKRPVTEVSVEALPARLLLDLGAIEDTLGSFGGLSGILDLSTSILSEGGLLTSPTSAGKPSKGVRFHGDPKPASIGSELKLNGRIGGVEMMLRGEACAVTLRTTTVKTVYREQGTIATVEHVVLTGPHSAHDTSIPITLDLATLRVEYLLSPADKDLERLLSLLTPSKDKYDDDEDILLDTLLRQRRKGALARASVGDVKVKVADVECLQALTALSDELSKLSAVAKYLPEDERPGLLTLVRIKDFEAQLPFNERFGKLQVVCQDFHCAHVGLPALLALSVGNVRASRMSHSDLIHNLIPLSGADNLPMLMARMLGDEAEPKVKVKLYNVCVEYSVPTILALTGMDVGAGAEEVVAELTKSVADIILQREESGKGEESPVHNATRTPTKRTNIEVLMHDCAVGLSPAGLPVKGLLILTDATITSLVPPETTLVATLELRKAALFVTDDAESTDPEIAAPARGAPNNTTTNIRLAAALSKRGYVSVGSIMSGKIAARVEDAAEGQTKSVEMDVRSELLLLETCADSTQTLIAILNGLAPPTPQSKQPKYLTQPMTIEDMMASFTGEPEAKPEARSETLFDVEEEPEDGADTLLDAPTLGHEADDLLMDSEMTSSLYGPVSGVFGDLDQPHEDEAGAGDFPETAESLLEEDPFEMTISPMDVGMSDSSLMRDLAKQCKPVTNEKPVDLGLYEIEDLAFDALGGGQQALGSQHRFNAPSTRGRKLLSSNTQKKLPFRLRLRDTHAIWNIHDGYDFQRTRDGITQAVEQVEARAEERKARRRQPLQDHEDQESVIGDVLFNSIYIGVPANYDTQELRRRINRGIDDLASETESVPLSGMSRPTSYSVSGRPIRQNQRRRLKLERSKAHKVAFELKGISVDLLVFPPDTGDVVSSVDVRVRDFEIFDNVPTSTWRKFLTHLDNGPDAREISRPMVHLELLNVKTLQDFAASEIVIHVALSALRLHVDQDALDFTARFFEFKDESLTDSAAGEQPFIQRLEIETVDLKLDYKPKRVDYGGIRSGHTSEFVNFVTLDAADIKLRHAIIYGLRGFAPLHNTLNDIWMPDVTRNQLPTVLAGLAPMRSLVNIGSGMRDVVAIPIREYRKDGRIVRSIQKGALHFGKTTTSELARLGAKLAIGTQNILQGAEGFLSPASTSPSGRPGVARRVSSEQDWHDTAAEDEEPEQRAISAYANQPLGIFSGLRTARRYLEHDLLTAKDAFIAVQGEVLESGSPGAAAAAVARRAPTVILRPIIGASRAVGTAMLGVGNQIDRGNLRRVDDVSGEDRHTRNDPY